MEKYKITKAKKNYLLFGKNIIYIFDIVRFIFNAVEQVPAGIKFVVENQMRFTFLVCRIYFSARSSIV